MRSRISTLCRFGRKRGVPLLPALLLLAVLASPGPAAAELRLTLDRVIKNFAQGANFEDPRLIYYDQRVDELYLYEKSTAMVFIMSPAGRLRYCFPAAAVADPEILFVTGRGDICLVSRTGMIYRYDYRGAFLDRRQLLPGKTVWIAGGNYSEEREALFFANQADNTVYGITMSGSYVFQQGGYARASDCLYHKGKVYVVDQERYKVLIYENGRLESQFGRAGGKPGTFSRARWVRIDGAGRIWIYDLVKQGLEIFDAGGNFLQEVGVPGYTAGVFAGDRLYAISYVLKAIAVFTIEERP